MHLARIFFDVLRTPTHEVFLVIVLLEDRLEIARVGHGLLQSHSHPRNIRGPSEGHMRAI